MKPLVHTMHIMVLIFLLLGSAGAFLYLQGNHTSQLIVGVLTAISYVAWGIIHHMLQKDLHTKIVVEYVLMGAIAIALLYFVLGR